MMKYCRDSELRRAKAISAIAFSVIWAAVIMMSILWLFNETVLSIPALFMLLSFGILLAVFYLWVVITIVRIETRKFRVTSSGLEIRYLGGKIICYSWDDISEVGICKVRYASRISNRCEVVLRCVVGQESAGPSQGFYGAWATELYEVFHLHNIICILYSDESFDEFQKLCPFKIVDYRGIKRNAYEVE